jgi:hypothetical protein
MRYSFFYREEENLVKKCKDELFFTFQHLKRILKSVNTPKDSNLIKPYVTDITPIEKWAHDAIDQVYLKYRKNPIFGTLTGLCIFMVEISPLCENMEKEINEIINELKIERKKNERTILCS